MLFSMYAHIYSVCQSINKLKEACYLFQASEVLFFVSTVLKFPSLVKTPPASGKIDSEKNRTKGGP